MLTEFCSKENEMLSYPKIGDKVMIRYGKKWAQYTPLHGREGIVAIVCLSKRCRNHGIEVDGKLAIIPRGNLFKAEE